MKKYLSMLLILCLLVTSLFLAGCKQGTQSTEKESQETKQPATAKELMESIPGMFFGKKDSKDDLINKIKHGIGEISIGGLPLFSEEGNALTASCDFEITDDKKAVMQAEAGIDNEKIKGYLELLEGKINILLPEVSEKYLSLDIAKKTNTPDFSKVIDGLKGIIAEENLVKETGSVEVFGNTIENATKVSVKIDETKINGVLDDLAKVIAGISKKAEGKDTTVSAGNVKIKAPTLNCWFVDDSLVKTEYSVDLESTSNKEEIHFAGYADSQISGENVKLVGMLTITDGKDTATVSFDGTVENGTVKFTAELKSGEKDTFSVTGSGTCSADALDIKASLKTVEGNVTVELPISFKITTADSSINIEIDSEVSIPELKNPIKISLKATFDDGETEKQQLDPKNKLSEKEVQEYLSKDFAKYVIKKMPNLFELVQAIATQPEMAENM